MTDEERDLLASIGVDPPSLVQRVTSFAKAAARHAVHGFPAVAPDVKAKRLELCTACEKYEPASERCTLCGCNMPVKTGWALEKCPLGKWG